MLNDGFEKSEPGKKIRNCRTQNQSKLALFLKRDNHIGLGLLTSKLTRLLWNRYILVLGLAILFVPQPVYAYLDPGVGSVIWQGLIGIMFAVLFLLKINYQKIRTRFNKRDDERKEN
jgi:hypothetical protein